MESLVQVSVLTSEEVLWWSSFIIRGYRRSIKLNSQIEFEVFFPLSKVKYNSCVLYQSIVLLSNLYPFSLVCTSSYMFFYSIVCSVRKLVKPFLVLANPISFHSSEMKRKGKNDVIKKKENKEIKNKCSDEIRLLPYISTMPWTAIMGGKCTVGPE